MIQQLSKRKLETNQNFPVPWSFTAFRFLFLTAAILKTNRDVFTKFKLAVGLNISAEKVHSQRVRKQLPAFAYNYLKNSYTEKVNMKQKPGAKMPLVAQKTIYNARHPSKHVRVENILSGPHSGVFFKLWIFLLVDTEN